MGEELFIQLRYCFQAGYTLPQYCVDNGIKKPLFVLEKGSECFLREIYAQFKYDKRLWAKFCFIDGDSAEVTKIPSRGGLFRSTLELQNISAMNLDRFDKIILLTKKKPDLSNDKVVSFADLERFLVQQTYADIPLLNFLQRNPKVALILTNFPRIRRYEGGKEFSDKLLYAEEIARLIRNSGGKHVETLLDKFGYTNEQVVEMSLGCKIKRNLDGTTSMLGANGLNDGDNYPLRQIRNGKRATAYQPETYRNKIYFFGSSHHYGVNAPFYKTMESYLQKMLNEANLPYRVENEAQLFIGRYEDIFYNLNAIEFAPGDIIFMWITGIGSNDKSIPFCDVSDAFDPPIDFKELYCRKGHVNELGYELIAKKYFAFLTENNFFRDVEFNYANCPPPPPESITDMVYLLNSSKAV